LSTPSLAHSEAAIRDRIARRLERAVRERLAVALRLEDGRGSECTNDPPMRSEGRPQFKILKLLTAYGIAI
jgi:hypothetical protein